MKRMAKKFQDLMIAATFAEAGDWDTARELTPKQVLSRETTWLARIFAAVAFAEADLRHEAISMINPASDWGRRTKPFTVEDLGLKGVRLMYGTVSV